MHNSFLVVFGKEKTLTFEEMFSVILLKVSHKNSTIVYVNHPTMGDSRNGHKT